MDLLSRHAGERPYRLATMLMNKHGIARRTANNVLARARKLLAEHGRVALRDMSDSLVFKVADLYRDCLVSMDRRSAVRILELMAELRRESLLDHAGDRVPKMIQFSIYDPRDAEGVPMPFSFQPGNGARTDVAQEDA